MKKFLSLFLSFFLMLNSVYATTADFLPSEDVEAIYSAIEQEVEKSPNRNLINFIISFTEYSIHEKLVFEDIEENKKEIFGDLLVLINQTHFSQEEVLEISNFFKWNLNQNNTSDLFYMFAGAFLAHKDFADFRGNIIDTINNRNLNNNPHPENTLPYILALKEMPSLDMFLSDSFPLDIVSVLERKVQELSYLGQKTYVGRGMLPHRFTYLNEYAADRCFLEAYSYFSPKESDSFFKTLVTTTIPLPHSLPGRNLKGEYLDNEDGMAHALAFEIIDILIRHYILTEQDDEVYRFIEDNAFRQGPYYFQFSLDALGIANTLYQSLEGENADARHNLWEERQGAFISDFKKSSPFARRLIVLVNKTSQLYLEYYAIGKIFSFAGKYILSPMAKVTLGLLPKNIQLRAVTKMYLAKGYVRQGLKKYLHDKPKYLYIKIANKFTGKRFLLPNPRESGATKVFLEESLKRAGYKRNSEIYKFFTNVVKDFNKADENTFNYLKNLTEYIPKQDFENFYALYNRIPSKYKGKKPFIRIIAINNKIAPEVESRVISTQGQVLANMMSLLKKGGKVSTAEYGGKDKVFSIVNFDNGTQIRFGAHEIDGRKIHMHFEKTISIGGMPYKLNKSFVVNTRMTMKVLITDDIKNLWLFAQKKEQDSFVKALYRIARNENLNVAEEKILGANMNNYAYRLNEYYLGTQNQRLKAVTNLMRATGKTTEQEAIDETLSRVLSSCYYSNSPELSNLVKRHLLNNILSRISIDMTNQEVAKILQMVLVENLKGSGVKGFSTLSATALKGSKLGKHIDKPVTRGKNPVSF